MQSKPRPQPSVADLATNALRSLSGRQYKEAIATLKELLKRERTREWEEKLAEAYLGRAREVASKGMFQEAAILWENHAGFLPGLAPSAEYLGWVLQAGQIPKLGKALAAVPESFAAALEGRGLLEAVALLALDNEKLLNALPRDHTVSKQQPVLRKALLAYSARRDGEVEECLQQVSSRSPYRNLRTLLKGLLLRERDPAAAREVLRRMDPDSACRNFALALEQSEDAETVVQVSHKIQAALDKLDGYGKAQRALLRDFRKADQAPGTRPLLDQVLRHRGELGDVLSRRFALATLPGCPEAIPLYERAFGKLSEFERLRIHALYSEANRDYDSARDHWLWCSNVLRKAPPDPEGKLNQALILRHLAEMAKTLEPPLAIDCLEKSLELDPEDKPSYLKLAELYEGNKEPKAVQNWVDRALEHYPRDPEVLVLAMQSAERRKAYKQVEAHARTLLEIDPINSQARRFLVEAHLGHARKQLKSTRLDLAERELAAAGKQDPQRRNPALRYLEGLYDYLRGDHASCRTRWREAWNLAGGGVPAWLQWAMEVLGAGLALAGPSKLVESLDKQHVVGKGELAALARQLGPYAKNSPQNLGLALKTLNPVLKRSFKRSDLGEEDFAAFCQALAQAARYELLNECAIEGNRRYFAPVFTYYQVLAHCKGDAGRLSFGDTQRLHAAAARAAHIKDQRTLTMIDGLLRRHEAALEEEFEDFPPFGPPPPIDLETQQKIIERLDDLSQGPTEEQIRKLMGNLSPEQLRDMSPEAVVKMLFGELLKGTGLDPEQILEDFSPPPDFHSGRKSKKRR